MTFRNSVQRDAEENRPKLLANLTGRYLGYCHDLHGRSSRICKFNSVSGSVGSFRGNLPSRIPYLDNSELTDRPQAGFFPGAVYLVTQWYPPNVIQQRLALLYTASAISGAFSGLLAYAISNMDGLSGVAGWRWIFILEGVVPTIFGLLLPLILPCSPEKVGWLSAEEKLFIDLRFRQAGHRSTTGEGDKFYWSLLLKTMSDWKILLAVLMAMVNAAPNAAFSYTMPTIINKLGFQASQAQLLTIPPYFCGAVSSWLSGRLADRFAWRFPFIVMPMGLLLVAFIILLILSANIEEYKGPMYFAVVLAQIGIYPLLPGISSRTTNNLPQSWKRSIGIAWLLAAANTASEFPFLTQKSEERY